MKKLLITFFICALCFSVAQGQKITLLTESTAIDGNALMMTREGSTGNVIKKITIANIFKDRIFTGTIVLPVTTSIGIISPTEISYLDNASSNIQAQLNNTVPLPDVGFVHADTNKVAGKTKLVTEVDLLNFTGGGGGGAATIFKLQFRTDTTAGAPHTGDSILVHTNFIGKHIEVYRGLAGHATESGAEKQLQNTTGVPNVADGFRFNSTTGQIIFRPVFVTNELVVIESTNTIVWTNLSIEGQESGLLTNLRAYWSLDEVSGTLVNDALGVYNGTTNAYTNEAGILGRCEKFQTDYDHHINFGTTIGDVGTSDFTIAAWINITSFPTGYDIRGIAGNWGDYPFFYMGADAYDQRIIGVINFSGSNIEILNNAALSTATWYHVAMVADRDGNLTLYLNGVAQTDVKSISAGAAVSIVNNNTFAVGRIGNYLPGHGFTGFIDEVYFGLRVLSAGEIQELMTKTYPFTP